LVGDVVGAERVAPRVQLEDLRRGERERALLRRVPRARRRDLVRRLVRLPLGAVDPLRSLVGAAPRAHLLARVELVDRRDGADVVIKALALPGGDARVEERIAEREE